MEAISQADIPLSDYREEVIERKLLRRPELRYCLLRTLGNGTPLDTFAPMSIGYVFHGVRVGKMLTLVESPELSFAEGLCPSTEVTNVQVLVSAAKQKTPGSRTMGHSLLAICPECRGLRGVQVSPTCRRKYLTLPVLQRVRKRG